MNNLERKIFRQICDDYNNGIYSFSTNYQNYTRLINSGLIKCSTITNGSLVSSTFLPTKKGLQKYDKKEMV